MSHNQSIQALPQGSLVLMLDQAMSFKKAIFLCSSKSGILIFEVLQAEIDVEKAKANYLVALQDGNERNINCVNWNWISHNTKFQRVMTQVESKTIIAEMDGVVIYAEPFKHNDVVFDQRVLVRVADPLSFACCFDVSNPADFADVQLGMEALKVTMRDKTYRHSRANAIDCSEYG